MEVTMTWKDKLELGLKDDAPFRRDNLPADEVQGPEEASGPGRSPVVTEVRDARTAAREHPKDQTTAESIDVGVGRQRPDTER
jgi:hypothetical protein